MSASGPVGILLINVGTPDSPTPRDVKTYLREFLSDPRVIDINPIGRWLLLNLFILPFRPKKSAAAYKAIWGPKGSPLLVLSTDLAQALQAQLGSDYRVEVGMRYGNPNIAKGIERLQEAKCRRIVFMPLYPQYSSAATGSTHDFILKHMAPARNPLPFDVRGDFYNHPGFIDAVAQRAQTELQTFNPDFVLFSYHGLPERQVRKSHTPEYDDCTLQGPCPAITPGNRYCYRAQSYETSRHLARALALKDEQWDVSFQSRLGRTPWIQPYTDELIQPLAERGIKKIAVATPSFVTDCLETIEEIGIRLKEDWESLVPGGELRLIPCVNADPAWVHALADIVRPTQDPSESSASPIASELG